MTEREQAALKCALRLLEHRFAAYAEAVLVDCGGEPARPAVSLIQRRDHPRAITTLREALSENG